MTIEQSLNQSYPLSPQDARLFQQNGFALLRNVANQTEIETFRPLIKDAVKRLNPEVRKIEDRDTYGKAFLQTMNLWEFDEQVRKFTLAKKFAGIAAGLMGVNNVRLYHDQALFKEAGGGFTPWHQDQYYWPLDTTNTITMWMPMIDITADMGMLTFASGSFRDGLVRNLEISDESEKALDDYVSQKKYPIFMPSFMKAGDATFHYGLTLHKAPGNSSALTREVMTIIYFADGARVSAPINEWQEKDRQRWLKGFPIGELATSLLNPKL